MIILVLSLICYRLTFTGYDGKPIYFLVIGELMHFQHPFDCNCVICYYYTLLSANNLLLISLQIQIDPYLGISDDLQVYLKPEVDVRGFGSVADNQLATSLLSELRNKLYESENVIVDILVQNLANITKV